MSYSKLSETWLCGSQINLLPNTIENYNNPKKLMYVHIPKTGGTLIENLFVNYKVGYKFENWSSLECINKNANYWHIPPSNFRKLDFSKLIVFTRSLLKQLLAKKYKLPSPYAWEFYFYNRFVFTHRFKIGIELHNKLLNNKNY